MIRDGQGNFYGTTEFGGTSSWGTVFKLDASGVETVLHSFTNGVDGGLPLAPVIRDVQGNLYGTTVQGGFGYGIVFRVDSTGVETVMYSFTGGSDGGAPYPPVTRDAAGNLYGMTYQGGAGGYGVVFEVNPTGHETVLYSFTENVAEAISEANLLLDSAGNLYGTTRAGGTTNNGTVFEIMPAATSPFLTFPLMNKTASTARINSVFDHSMFIGQGQTEQFGYCPDDIVTAYTGETGMSPYGSSSVGIFTCGKPRSHQVTLYGWAQPSGLPFTINGHYVGSLEPQYLSYDGHPGFDYVTKDQNANGTLCKKGKYCNAAGQTPVLAAAAGAVVCVNISATIKAPCLEGPGEIKINHGNGYFTIYLHLSSAVVSANAAVGRGQQIGVSGSTGTTENGPHLHFEVRKRQQLNDDICPQPTSCIPVDPYGWTGTYKDPYTRAVNVKLWQ